MAGIQLAPCAELLDPPVPDMGLRHATLFENTDRKGAIKDNAGFFQESEGEFIIGGDLVARVIAQRAKQVAVIKHRLVVREHPAQYTAMVAGGFVVVGLN